MEKNQSRDLIFSNNADTITAIATPPGVGGVGIIRISGPKAKAISGLLTKKTAVHQNAIYSAFLDSNDEQLDFGYLLYFKSPHSFTGEDVVEVQCHGGPVVIDLILQRILQLGARLAEAGEFSKQAFLNDKIDLVQAEAIADLIESSSVASVKLAQRALKGDFSKAVNSLAANIIKLRMYVEASLDFPEEEIDFISDGNVLQKLEDLFAELKAILAKATQGAMVREGLQIVIIGKPNAGKSTIINQLSGQETAIVTSIAGTTRDILREKILINDIPIHVVDTAGLRDSTDEIEQEGIRRAKNAALSADLILLVVEHQNSSELEINKFIENEGITGPLLIAINKIDQASIKPNIIDNKVFISAKDGEGMKLLKSKILEMAGVNQKEAQGSYLARRRHLNALEKALDSLTTGLNNLKSFHAGELLAEDLKQAHQSLCEITGEFSADDLLGEIFSSFCIGK